MSALTRSVRGSANRLLYHVLEEPQLLAAVRELPAPLLARLIEHVGIEDAGELIALTSTPQLAEVFDAELWQSRSPGADETFQPERFALFLRLLYEAGESFVVERLLSLPRRLLTLAVHKLLLVVDIDALTVRFESAGRYDDGIDRVVRALDNAQFEEWEEFRIIARDSSAFEDVWNALLLLDREDHELVRDLIERCCEMDGELIEESGLYEVLNEEEVLESDLAAERSERRAAQGFIAPADARAFLELAGRATIDEARDGRDPIARAYFRELAAEEAPQRLTKMLAADGGSEKTGEADVGRLLALMKEARVMDDEPDAPNVITLLTDDALSQSGAVSPTNGHVPFAQVSSARNTQGTHAARAADVEGHATAAPSPKRAKAEKDVKATASAKAKRAGKGVKSMPSAGAKQSVKGKKKAAPAAASGKSDVTTGRVGSYASETSSLQRSQFDETAAASSERQKRLTLMAASMRELRERDPALHAQRTEELGFLANILVAGSRHDGRTYRPVEAIECALAVCSVGLERAHADMRDSRPEATATGSQPPSAAEASTLLLELTADRLFRAGLHALRTEISERARAHIARLLGVELRDVAAAINDGSTALVAEHTVAGPDAFALAALAEAEPWLAGKLAAADHLFVASEADMRRALRFLEVTASTLPKKDPVLG
jgi:hypothetical protein